MQQLEAGKGLICTLCPPAPQIHPRTPGLTYTGLFLPGHVSPTCSSTEGQPRCPLTKLWGVDLPVPSVPCSPAPLGLLAFSPAPSVSSSREQRTLSRTPISPCSKPGSLPLHTVGIQGDYSLGGRPGYCGVLSNIPAPLI